MRGKKEEKGTAGISFIASQTLIQAGVQKTNKQAVPKSHNGPSGGCVVLFKSLLLWQRAAQQDTQQQARRAKPSSH